MLNPISVCTKLLMQRLWQQRVMWDEPLDEGILKEWTAILADICKSSAISINRIFFSNITSPNSLQLHVFADASTKAYGAVAYLSNLDQTSFVMAKGCVALLKQITLPKLTLMAAVAAAKLASLVIDCLHLKATTYMWTDSQIVLCWLQSTKVLPPFITHRVEEIKQLFFKRYLATILRTSSPEDSTSISFRLHHCGGTGQSGYLITSSGHHGTSNQYPNHT